MIRCPQLIFTWNPSTLHGSAGHGVVLQSAVWPGSLGLPSGQKSFLTRAFTDTDVAAGTAELFVAHHGQARLFGCRTALGLDQSGRPGNFLVHLVHDETGTIGALDVLDLGAAGWFVTGLASGVKADDSWQLAEIEIFDSWREAGVSGTPPWYSDDRLSGEPVDVAEYREALTQLCPADLVNQLSLTTGDDGEYDLRLDAGDIAGRLTLALGGELSGFASEAARTGVDEEPGWWQRVNWTTEQWREELLTQTLLSTSADQLDADELVDAAELDGSKRRGYLEELAKRVADDQDGTAPAVGRLTSEMRGMLLGALIDLREASQWRARATRALITISSRAELPAIMKAGGFDPLAKLPMNVTQTLIEGSPFTEPQLLELSAHPKFWQIAQKAQRPTRFDQQLADLALTGQVEPPDWFIPVLLEHLPERMPDLIDLQGVKDAYQRVSSLVGVPEANRIFLDVTHIDAWWLVTRSAMTNQGVARPETLAETFNRIASTAPESAVGQLRLATRAMLARWVAIIGGAALLIGLVIGFLVFRMLG